MPKAQGSTANGIGCVIGVVVALAGLAWLFAVFALPHYRMGYTGEEAHRGTMDEISAEIERHHVDTSNLVFVPLSDGGLDIFVTRSSFESVGYPDREDFTLAIADTWCAYSSSAFLPSVRIRDIQSGETIVRKFCDLDLTPDPTGSYGGTVHNTTANLYASFDAQMIVPNNSIKGCMQVGSPLVGTGPIVGSLRQRKFVFDLNESNLHIHFEGARVGHTIRGKYFVTNANGRQMGDFTLHQDSIRVSVPTGYNLDRCPQD